jgi:hypothetical protein
MVDEGSHLDVLAALPQDVDKYADEAQASTMEDFEQRRPYPFLLYARNRLWDRTLVATRAAHAPRRETAIVNYQYDEGGLTFLSVIRSRKKLTGSGIVLGRTSGPDIVVPVPSISTNHVSFMPPDVDRAYWTLTDLASRNGTYLMEDQLKPYDAVQISNGQYMRLGGNLVAWFLFPGHLWTLLRDTEKLKKYTEI